MGSATVDSTGLSGGRRGRIAAGVSTGMLARHGEKGHCDKRYAQASRSARRGRTRAWDGEAERRRRRRMKERGVDWYWIEGAGC